MPLIPGVRSHSSRLVLFSWEPSMPMPRISALAATGNGSHAPVPGDADDVDNFILSLIAARSALTLHVGRWLRGAPSAPRVLMGN
jgi:hypothetical protein